MSYKSICIIKLKTINQDWLIYIGLATSFFLHSNDILDISFIMFVVRQCPNEIKNLNESKLTYVYKDKCLLFVSKAETSSVEASNKCRKRLAGITGHLVTIPDMDTMDFIMNMLNNTLQWTQESVWVGLSASGGGWKWAAGNYHSTFSFIYSHVISAYWFS